MKTISTPAIKRGLGVQGIVGAIFLGFLSFLQPLFGETDNSTWAKYLLILASVVYLVFSIVWDRKHLKLKNLQVIAATLFLLLTLLTGKILFVAIGLFFHALWDFWHLATCQKYVPMWYAGACFYVDLSAVFVIWLKGY